MEKKINILIIDNDGSIDYFCTSDENVVVHLVQLGEAPNIKQLGVDSQQSDTFSNAMKAFGEMVNHPKYPMFPEDDELDGYELEEKQEFMEQFEYLKKLAEKFG